MATSEPAIAGLTPSVSASAQNTISGPNSARTKRAAAASLGMGASPGERGDDRLERRGPIDDPDMIDAGEDRHRNSERRQHALVSLRIHQFVVGAGDDRNAALGLFERVLPVLRRGVVQQQAERIL